METVHVDEIRDAARRIAAEKLKPVATDLDRTRAFPLENLKLLADAGFQRLIIAENEGGLGLGRSPFASAVAELSKACASTAHVYSSSATRP